MMSLGASAGLRKVMLFSHAWRVYSLPSGLFTRINVFPRNAGFLLSIRVAVNAVAQAPPKDPDLRIDVTMTSTRRPAAHLDSELFFPDELAQTVICISGPLRLS
jgi:hypothetical protein